MKAGAGDAFADICRLSQEILDLQRAVIAIRENVGTEYASGTIRDLDKVIDEKIRQVKIRRRDWSELSGGSLESR